MDIFSRLKEYIAISGMPTTQFADYAQIPRPTLSQILNGRNRKISNEIIAKLHTAFPNLNVMWLMFGDGEPELGANTQTSEPQNSEKQASSDTQAPDAKDDTPRQRTIDFLAEDDQSVDFTSSQTPQTPKTEFSPRQHDSLQGFVAETPAQADTMHDPRMMSQLKAAAQQAMLTKKIMKIMVFYEDATFQSFIPSPQ